VRRFFLIAALPFALAACSSDQPAPQAPPANPPAASPPAAEAPAQSTPASDVAKAPLFGNWAADLANCGSPIVISETRFEGAENSCEISSIEDDGDGSFTVSMSCNSQGQTSAERISMMPAFGPQGEGIVLRYLDRGGDPVSVFRCK
jgi:hypothetical protein